MNSPTGTAAQPSAGSADLPPAVTDLAALVSAGRMAATVAALAGEGFEEWRVGTAGGAGARAWLVEQLIELGIEARVDGFEVAGYGSAANVHGTLRESAPGGADLLLTAHYDGVGDLGGVHRPGASDNASGVAVVLEAAVSVEAGGPARPLLEALDAAGRALGVPLRGGRVASDNRRYAGAGLDAVGLGAGMPGYHTEHDTPANVDPATLGVMARLVVVSVWTLAGAADLERSRREEGLEHE